MSVTGMNDKSYRFTYFAAAGALVVGTALAAGCSDMPQRIEQPPLDVDAAIEQALAKYDTNHSGSLESSELDASPTLGYFDGNGDSRVEAEEIRSALDFWKKSRLGLVELYVVVTWKERPLSGATVTLQPESFLGEAISEATGETDEEGTARICIPRAELPNPHVSGARVGVYRVIVSKLEDGREQIPAEYNVDTRLGCEVKPGMAPIKRFAL